MSTSEPYPWKVDDSPSELVLPRAYDTFDGRRDYRAWGEALRRSEELDYLGIEPPELPAEYADALGARRTARIERRVEDKLVGFAVSHPGHEELAEHAMDFGSAARALNMAVSRRVASLEQRHADLAAELAELEQALHPFELVEPCVKAEHVRRRLAEVSSDLELLAAHEDHPDRWLEHHGRTFVDGLAARLELQRGRARADAARTYAPR